MSLRNNGKCRKLMIYTNNQGPREWCERISKYFDTKTGGKTFDKIIAAFTTRLIQYPRRRALALDWVGGTQMKEWEDQLIDTMKRYGNELGCSHLEGYGRKGWGRALKKYGFYPEYIAYRMEL